MTAITKSVPVERRVSQCLMFCSLLLSPPIYIAAGTRRGGTSSVDGLSSGNPAARRIAFSAGRLVSIVRFSAASSASSWRESRVNASRLWLVGRYSPAPTTPDNAAILLFNRIG